MRWRDGIIIFLSFALFPFPFPFPCRLFSISLDLSGRCALSNKLYVVKADIGRLLVRIDYNQKKMYMLYFFAKSGIQAQILGVLFFVFLFFFVPVHRPGRRCRHKNAARCQCVCVFETVTTGMPSPKCWISHVYSIFFQKVITTLAAQPDGIYLS